MNRYVPCEIEQAVVQDYCKMSITALQYKYGLGKKMLCKILKVNGIRRRGNCKSEQLMSAVIHEYTCGQSIRAISVKYNIDTDTVRRILLRGGITLRGNKILPEIEHLILSAYPEKSVAAISRQYDVGMEVIRRVLHTAGQVTSVWAPKALPYVNIFHDHKSAIAAYWAGFLMADGCLTLSGNSLKAHLQLILSEKDVMHMHAYARAIKFPVEKIGQYTVQRGTQLYSYVRISVLATPELISDLSFYGIVPRKTYNFVAPKVPEGVLRDYLRGWIDGDGSVKLTKPWRLGVVGNVDSMRWFIHALQRIGFTGYFVEYTPKNSLMSRSIRITRRGDIFTLAKLLAKSSDIKLERKWVGLDALTESAQAA